MTRILFTADTHLGFSAYNKISPSGQNQRQEDVFNAFGELVDDAIRCKVDAVIICGDLFHSLKPSMRTLAFCMGKISLLQNADIKVLIIGGNHDTPKSTGISSPLEALAFFDNVQIALDKTVVGDIGNCRFVMVPYIANRDNLLSALKEASDMTSKERANILMVHLAYGKFQTMQYDEVCLMPEEMDKIKRNFDFVAMGHYHGSYLGKDIGYSGSLERLTFNEVNDKKGYYIINTDGNGISGIDFVERKAREMLDLPDIDLSGSTDPTDDILHALPIIDGKIYRMKINKIPALLYRSLDFRKLRNTTESATNFEFLFDIEEEKVTYEVTRTSFKSMVDEWKEFTKERKADEKLIELGVNYILRGD